jgi:hypothetical protein
MDLDRFYSENPVSSWKKVVGEDLHYHYGAGGPEPFKQTVYNLLEFLPPNSKILDCGCGWGGPARLMMEEGHDVTGVTISKTQADYITDFPVVHADLHDFQPTEEYDAAVFLESYFHLKDPRQVFDNLVPYVKHIVIADIVNPVRVYNEEWGITLRPKEFLFGDLYKVGYAVVKHYERIDFASPTLRYWSKNIAKLPEEEIYGQIKTLKGLCDGHLLDEDAKLNARQIFVHAKRR